jgi:formiminoglutamase
MGRELSGYEPGVSSAWRGRVDATEPRAALRWHQVVACLDLRERASGGAEPAGICFVGYACDEGVARNLGRRGAEAGPRDIRRALANLPVGFTSGVGLYDAGDVGCVGGDVEAAQLSLAEAVERIRSRGHFPIVLGGGHDLEYGHWLGVRRSLSPGAQLGVLSFDAHFDLRPHDRGANSGTAFSQIAAACRREGGAMAYLCLGLQPSANTVQLFRMADELGVEYELARDIVGGELDRIRERIDRFSQRVDDLAVTIDADVLSSAFAPGVSAPQPLGLHPDTVLRLLEHAMATGKVGSLDVAEVSPRFDDDGRTAKVAALFVFAAVERLIPDEARIDPSCGAHP